MPSTFSSPFLKVLTPGWGATMQDDGRHGWRRFGVPTSGAMDAHAAAYANRLLGNPPWAAVVELLLQGARFEVLADTWVAITGAARTSHHPAWRAVQVPQGEILSFDNLATGVWTYLAIEGGWAAPQWLDSASTLATAGMGQPLAKGQILCRHPSEPRFCLPPGVAGRVAPHHEQRDYARPPHLKMWRGPQWEWIADQERHRFFNQAWTVAAQSNRVGYRLTGQGLIVPPRSMISEPVRIGSVQLPPDGQPVVILRDGPTVGGYPKIGVIDPDDVNWLVQTAPGQKVHFTPVETPVEHPAEPAGRS